MHTIICTFIHTFAYLISSIKSKAISVPKF